MSHCLNDRCLIRGGFFLAILVLLVFGFWFLVFALFKGAMRSGERVYVVKDVVVASSLSDVEPATPL